MNKWLNDGSRMNREVHVRFCEGLGVQFLRPTHLYVSVSRGREDNTIYCDKSSLHEMSFEDRKKLKGKPVAEKRAAFAEHYRNEVAAIVGASHQKDSTQNYFGMTPNRAAELMKRFGKLRSFEKPISGFKQSVAASFKAVNESIEQAVSKIKSLIAKEKEVSAAQEKQRFKSK